MTQLKPFQQEGAAFLAARTRALLADEPGVGKTGQLITAANMVGARRVKVVCPMIGIRHWERECEKWGLQGDVDVIAWDHAHKLKGIFAEQGGPAAMPMQWDVLIADESHFGKNPQARRTRAVFAKGGLGWYARRIWAASGTPAPNHVGELWPMLAAFGKTKMDQEAFTAYYCYVDDQGKVRGNRPERVEELRVILKSFALRRLKKDVLPELGPIDIQDWYVKPSADFLFTERRSPDAAALSAHLELELTGKSDEELLAFLAGDQEFATLRRYNALLKAPAVFEQVRFEIENGLVDKIVIYGYHREALDALSAAFTKAGITAALVHGDTPRDYRDNIIEGWKRNGQVLLASIMVASTVLDFTCAHQGIMLELDWVPGNNWQAMQRMHRHGQDKPVTVRIAHGTPVDEIVNGVLIRKTKQLAEIFD